MRGDPKPKKRLGTSEKQRAARFKIGNLMVSEGAGSWHFKWQASATVAGSVEPNGLAAGGRGWIEFSAPIVEHLADEEIEKLATELIRHARARRPHFVLYPFIETAGPIVPTKRDGPEFVLATPAIPVTIPVAMPVQRSEADKAHDATVALLKQRCGLGG